MLRLAADTEAGPLDDLLGHSLTDWIAVGSRAGQKVFTLQTRSAHIAAWNRRSGERWGRTSPRSGGLSVTTVAA